MLLRSKKVRKEIRNIGKSVTLELSADIRSSLDAQYVLGRWRAETRRAGASAPFALFSYYEPTCGCFNPGDAIQTIAVKQALEKLGIKELAPNTIVRDELSLYDGPAVRCVMQGWFSHNNLFWPSPLILPVFVGTHFSLPAQRFVLRLLEYAPNIRRSIEIGCRDLFTLEFCNRAGIQSYFSRCLTLTLPKRDSVSCNTKVFIVDVPDEYIPFIPKKTLEGAEIFSQRAQLSDIGGKAYSPVAQMKLGERYLSLYRDNAELVVTTAIHVAMPCLAMGIPVVFIEGPETRDPNRYTALSGIVPVHKFTDLKKKRVDFNPGCPDLEPLKEGLLKNLALSVAMAGNESVNSAEVSDVRHFIAEWQT